MCWTIHSSFVDVRTDGIGLSAPHAGINIQLTVFNTFGERGEGEEIVLVYPQITRYSKKIKPYEEGSLSFPRIYLDVEVSIPNAYWPNTTLFVKFSPCTSLHE